MRSFGNMPMGELSAEYHVDEGEWSTRLRRTHLCQECGTTWRPAAVSTVGALSLTDAEAERATPPETAEERRIPTTRELDLQVKKLIRDGEVWVRESETKERIKALEAGVRVAAEYRADRDRLAADLDAAQGRYQGTINAQDEELTRLRAERDATVTALAEYGHLETSKHLADSVRDALAKARAGLPLPTPEPRQLTFAEAWEEAESGPQRIVATTPDGIGRQYEIHRLAETGPELVFRRGNGSTVNVQLTSEMLAATWAEVPR